MVLFASRSGDDGIRVGISVSKRVGGAVVRNRVKRRIREAVRLRLDSILPGWDLLFIVRPAAAEATQEDLAGAVERLLSISGIVVAEPCRPSSSA
jgi:ribonuclease P protein component